MCKEFSNTLSLSEVEAFFAAVADRLAPPPAPCDLFTPGREIPVIPSGAPRVLTARHWGWSKREGGLLINARAETLAAKPFFSKHADAKRCLVPATGFYEASRSRRSPQPWHFTVASTPLVGLAGLMNEEGSVVILTTEPNACVRRVHNRMPVLLRHETLAAWLDPRAPFLSFGADVFASWPADDMLARSLAGAAPTQMDLF